MLYTAMVKQPVGCHGIGHGRGCGQGMARDEVESAPGRESQPNIDPKVRKRVIMMLPQPAAQLNQSYLIDLLTRTDDKFTAIGVS